MSSDRPGKDRAASSPEKGERRNTLRLNQRELGTLLDEFDAPDIGKTHANREFIRWPFRCDALQVVVSPPGGGVSRVTMACRNISRTGISLLHSCYMHTGTKCTVMLPHPQRGEMPVQGWVARCDHRSGVIHEIGISFTEPVEVRELIRPDFFADCFSLERIKPEDLLGNVLYVDDSEMDVRIVKHFLRGTSLSVRTAGTVAAALASLESSPDLLITDFDLPDGTGIDLIAAARQRGCRMPIILATSDTSDATRQVIVGCPPDACLAKPLTQNLLQRAIGEFLIVKRKAQGSQAPAGPDTETAALVQSYIGSMKQVITQFEAAIRAGNAAQARSLCLQIAGSAPTVGFTDLGEMAQETAGILTRTRSVPESLKQLRALVGACERTRSRAAA